jgi:hypothetical protein
MIEHRRPAGMQHAPAPVFGQIAIKQDKSMASQPACSHVLLRRLDEAQCWRAVLAVEVSGDHEEPGRISGQREGDPAGYRNAYASSAWLMTAGAGDESKSGRLVADPLPALCPDCRR